MLYIPYEPNHFENMILQQRTIQLDDLRLMLGNDALVIGELAVDELADDPCQLLDQHNSQAYLRGSLLVDDLGRRVTTRQLTGRWLLVTFGYAHCPDVCPTTLAELRGVMDTLGKDADRVQVLFVTVDPERDTQDLLAKYVPAFDPRFLGLYGDEEATRRTAKEFKIFYEKRPGSAPGAYTVDHSAQSYVFDPQGRLRLFSRHGMPVEGLKADVEQLLAGR